MWLFNIWAKLQSVEKFEEHVSSYMNVVAILKTSKNHHILDHI